MEAKLLNSLSRTPPLTTTIAPAKLSAAATTYSILSPFHRKLKPLRFSFINSSSSGGGADETSPEIDSEPRRTQITPPPETVEVRFRRRSRRRSRQQSDDGGQFAAKPTATRAAAPAKKTWEEMSVAEKAVELYMGEKGVLFWLNKFAYASIFIVIGGWILFRFVGPSLNLYQLDTPPLAPGSMFKGSS